MVNTKWFLTLSLVGSLALVSMLNAAKIVPVSTEKDVRIVAWASTDDTKGDDAVTATSLPPRTLSVRAQDMQDSWRVNRKLRSASLIDEYADEIVSGDDSDDDSEWSFGSDSVKSDVAVLSSKNEDDGKSEDSIASDPLAKMVAGFALDGTINPDDFTSCNYTNQEIEALGLSVWCRVTLDTAVLTSGHLRTFTSDDHVIALCQSSLEALLEAISPYINAADAAIIQRNVNEQPLLMYKLAKVFFRLKNSKAAIKRVEELYGKTLKKLSCSDKAAIAYQVVVKEMLLEFAKGDVTNLTFKRIFHYEPTANWKARNPGVAYLVRPADFHYVEVEDGVVGEVISTATSLPNGAERLVMSITSSTTKSRANKYELNVVRELNDGTVEFVEDVLIV